MLSKSNDTAEMFFSNLLSPGIEITLDTMPDNGVILVFTDAGSHQLELENVVKAKSEMKNVNIFFALYNTIDTTSMEVYERLSNGQIFIASSDGSLGLDTEKFLEAVVHTVRKYLLIIVMKTFFDLKGKD